MISSPRSMGCNVKFCVMLMITFVDINMADWFGSTTKEIEYLDRGRALEAAGQFLEALAQYKLGLEENPSNYLSQFRCGMVCIDLGDSKSALKFLSKAFELHTDFTEAIVERGGVYLKLGDLQSAKDDFNMILRREPLNSEVKLRIKEIDNLKQVIPFAKLLFKQKDYVGSREALEQILKLCPWDVVMREIRAECYINEGKHGKAIADIQSTLRHRRLRTPGYLKLSLILYDIGDTDKSLRHVQECLKLDPDHNECRIHYKKVKTLKKLMQSADQNQNDMHNGKCRGDAQKILQTEPAVQYYVIKANSLLCHCHLPAHLVAALAACDIVLATNPDNIQARIDRADIAMEITNEKLHQAVTDYLYIKSRTEDNTHVIDGLKKAKHLLKISKRRDYYRILGLDRFVSYEDVLKAYKNLAKVWHPDKFKGDDKLKAEKMFLDLTAAKEVLTDQNKRAAHDRGEDPLASKYD